MGNDKEIKFFRWHICQRRLKKIGLSKVSIPQDALYVPLERITMAVSPRICVQLAASDSLEDKFKKLEGNDVDDELAQMKRGQLKSGSTSSSPRQQLPEGRPIRY